jgi:YD repeat-containing protein
MFSPAFDREEMMTKMPMMPTARAMVSSLLLVFASGLTSFAQSYAYDEAGRLIRVAYPQGNGIAYSYDATDNLTSVTSLSLPVAPAQLTVTRLSPTSARLTWVDTSSNETEFVIFRKRLGTNDWETIGTITAGMTAYIDSSLVPGSDYIYRIAARGAAGLSAYSNEESSTFNASVDVNITSGGTRSTLTAGTSETVQAGYAMVDVEFGKAPYGTAVFSLRQNDTIVSEVGVPASPPTRAARIFIDYRTGVASGSGTLEISTGLAVVNLGNGAAAVTYTLRNLTGNVLASGNGSIALSAHTAKFIQQIRDIAPDFNLPVDFPTATKFGSLEISSDQPLSMVALRLTTNQRGETLMTSTPIADLMKPPAGTPAFFPQFADGGGYVGAITLMNSSNTASSGTIEIFDGTGSPLTVHLVGGTAASAFAYALPPGGSAYFQTDGSSPQLTTGWVRLTPDPGSSTPVGAGLFQFTQNGIVVTESAVPSASPTTNSRIYIDKSNNHDTGLAIINPGSALINVTLKAFQSDGTTTAGSGPLSLDLNARGHRAQFVGQMISNLPDGFKGVLEITASAPYVALTLRSLVNSRGDFLLTTFPIADLNEPAPEPIVFPQIADGGGYTTELILLSSGGAAQTTIRFLADDGTPLSVGRK